MKTSLPMVRSNDKFLLHGRRALMPLLFVVLVSFLLLTAFSGTGAAKP